MSSIDHVLLVLLDCAAAAGPYLLAVPLGHAAAVVRDGAGLADHDVVACKRRAAGGRVSKPAATASLLAPGVPGRQGLVQELHG